MIWQFNDWESEEPYPACELFRNNAGNWSWAVAAIEDAGVGP